MCLFLCHLTISIFLLLFISAQVQKLQKILKKRRHDDVKTGSVEDFQGQERRVIIISTVRSNPDFLTLDTEYRIGFLDNPKVTRCIVFKPHMSSVRLVMSCPPLFKVKPMSEAHFRSSLVKREACGVRSSSLL